jgi:hypothetical protein
MLVKGSFYVLLLFLAVLLGGCAVDMSHPEFRALRIGHTEHFADGTMIDSEFVCPTNARCYVVIVLPAEWQSGSPIKPCQHPSFNFSVGIDLLNQEGENVLTTQVGTNAAVYTTWHNPRKSIVLYAKPPLYSVLVPGMRYHLRLAVTGSIPDPSEAEVWLNWVQE